MLVMLTGQPGTATGREGIDDLDAIARAMAVRGQPRFAAELYLRNGYPLDAARYFEAAGAWREAAEAWLHAGRLREAAAAVRHMEHQLASDQLAPRSL